jgi:hypothetical protein
MRGTATIMITATMTTRTIRNMARSFQRPRDNWPPSAADPWCLPSTYIRTRKLAIYF